MTPGMPLVSELATRCAIGAVRTYQWTVRPMIGPNCRFWPSCSDYAIDAFREHGTLRGGALTARRILRCNPWHTGGVDLVPKREATTRAQMRDTAQRAQMRDTAQRAPVRDTAQRAPVRDTAQRVPACDTAQRVSVRDTAQRAPVRDEPPVRQRRSDQDSVSDWGGDHRTPSHGGDNFVTAHRERARGPIGPAPTRDRRARRSQMGH